MEKSIELCPEEEAEADDNVNRELASGIASLTINAGDSNGDPDSAPSVPSSGGNDPLSAKSHFPVRSATVQPRPGHAHVTSPRAVAPATGVQSMPRSTPQASLLNANRTLNSPLKNDGSGNNGNQQQQPPPASQ